METNEPKKRGVQLKTVHNPTSEDLHFQYDSAEYLLKAGESKDFVDYIGNHACKKLADKNVMTNDPSEHKVLTTAYAQNSDIEQVAQLLKVDLKKIRAEAITKEKEKAKVINLEAEVMRIREEMEELKKEKQQTEIKEEENVSAEEAEEEVEEPQTIKVEEKIDKRTKEYKDSQKEE